MLSKKDPSFHVKTWNLPSVYPYASCHLSPDLLCCARHLDGAGGQGVSVTYMEVLKRAQMSSQMPSGLILPPPVLL